MLLTVVDTLIYSTSMLPFTTCFGAKRCQIDVNERLANVILSLTGTCCQQQPADCVAWIVCHFKPVVQFTIEDNVALASSPLMSSTSNVGYCYG